MNTTTRDETAAVALSGLAVLRQPVPEHLVSQLPKGTKAQNECPASEKKNCAICGGWHHPKVQHLSYVGHAAATHLLLDADPFWNWEPLAYSPEGLPLFDATGGLWIKLTVCGLSRLGYGAAEKKGHMDTGSREKEVIGDALRNAAIRFGLALELWSKADIHGGNESDKWFADCLAGIRNAANPRELKERTQAFIAEARARGDQAAEDDFLIAQADKMAYAKKKTAAPPAASNNKPPANHPPQDLADEDVPF